MKTKEFLNSTLNEMNKIYKIRNEIVVPDTTETLSEEIQEQLIRGIRTEKTEKNCCGSWYKYEYIKDYTY